MRFRLLVALVAVCVAATAETLSVQQLVTFLRNAVKVNTDREIAGFLSKAKLSERLDDRTIEDLQGIGIGPNTLKALEKLKEETENLGAAAPAPPEVKPKPIPIPNSEEQAAIMDDVRKYALAYSKGLPDFICTQVTRRFAAARPGTKYGGAAGSDIDWHALDVLQIRLTYFNQREQYKLVRVNERFTDQDYRDLGGATATGDFGSLLRDIFEPGTLTQFAWSRWATLRGELVMAFAYQVEQSHSQWHILVKDTGDHLVPAYHGEVFVEPDTHAVMRVTLVADHIPPSFPVQQAETTLDYTYQDISGHTFLLPYFSRVIMGDGQYVQKLDQEFRLYRKYSAESEVKYDSDLLPPLPEDQAKDAKDAPGAPAPVVKKK